MAPIHLVIREKEQVVRSSDLALDLISRVLDGRFAFWIELLFWTGYLAQLHFEVMRIGVQASRGLSDSVVKGRRPRTQGSSGAHQPKLRTQFGYPDFVRLKRYEFQRCDFQRLKHMSGIALRHF